MGTLLTDDDEGVHPVGPASNWNESRYVDFWDPRQRVGGWFRIGNRPNEGHAEMTACVNLPDGTTAFQFSRSQITENTLDADGQRWGTREPWRRTTVSFSGDMVLLPDAWALTDPARAFRQHPVAPARVDLESRGDGLTSVMGFDQDHIARIFLPGQADFHYQCLARTTGTVEVGSQHFAVDGRGGRDHSWGARNWHAKRYLRWLIALGEDGDGFMLVRAVGPTKQTRGGFLWQDGEFHLVDDVEMVNTYAGPPHHELLSVDVIVRSGTRSLTATGTPLAWLPLRHRQAGDDGRPAVLRIVKSPTNWVLGDGRSAAGMAEYHDLMVDGRPIGLHD